MDTPENLILPFFLFVTFSIKQGTGCMEGVPALTYVQMSFKAR